VQLKIQIIVSGVHAKILNVNVFNKNVNALLNSHAKEYKKQATTSIIKNFMLRYLINMKIFVT
jgi:hypothetical protein